MVRSRYTGGFLALALLASLCFSNTVCSSQDSPGSPARVQTRAARGIYLVFPFENAGASPRLDWLGEGLEELMIQRLSAAGEQVYSHAGRLGVLEQYGLPSGAKLSRATMLHIAEDLDADYVLFGKFTSDGISLIVESRVMRVNPTTLLPAAREAGTLDSLMELQEKLAWRMLSTNDHSYPLSLAEFKKLQRPLRLDAFEHYTRGLLASQDEDKLRELHEAARLETEWPDPDFALADVYFTRRDCNSALQWYARIPTSHEKYPEAIFSSGVCRLLLNQPDRAEEVFAALQTNLRKNMISGADLPEILNNLAIARARQDKGAAAEADLRRAADIDPDDGDYPFNSGLLALRAGEFNDAAKHFKEAVARDPENSEDRALLILALDKGGAKAEANQEREAAKESFGPNGLPAIHGDTKPEMLSRLDRIKPELDTTMMRLQIEAAPAMTSTTAGATGSDGSAMHVHRGRQDLSAGRMEEAEKEFRTALTIDPADPAAHRGLGDVYRNQSKLDEAAKELQASLHARDSAAVRTTLAHVYLEQHKPELAKAQVDLALKLAPNYSDAKKLKEYFQNSKDTEKKPGGIAQ